MRNEISSCVFCREILLNTDICDNCGTNQKIARLICAEKISFKHNAFRPLLSMKPAKEQLYIEDTPVFQVNCNKRTFNNFTIIFLFSAIIIVGIYSHWFLLAPIVSYIMAYIFIAIYLISLFFLYHKFKNDWNITFKLRGGCVADVQ